MKHFVERHRYLLIYLSISAAGFLTMALKGVQ